MFSATSTVQFHWQNLKESSDALLFSDISQRTMILKGRCQILYLEPMRTCNVVSTVQPFFTTRVQKNILKHSRKELDENIASVPLFILDCEPQQVAVDLVDFSSECSGKLLLSVISCVPLCVESRAPRVTSRCA